MAQQQPELNLAQHQVQSRPQSHQTSLTIRVVFRRVNVLERVIQLALREICWGLNFLLPTKLLDDFVLEIKDREAENVTKWWRWCRVLADPKRQDKQVSVPRSRGSPAASTVKSTIKGDTFYLRSPS